MPLSTTQKFWYLPWTTYVTVLLLTLLQPTLSKVVWPPAETPFPEPLTYTDPILTQPKFTGCPSGNCTYNNLEEYLHQQTTYRSSSTNTGQAGLAVVRLIIAVDGSIVGIDILRDPGFGRGADALRIARAMSEGPVVWEPARSVSGWAVEATVNLKIRYSNFVWAS